MQSQNSLLHFQHTYFLHIYICTYIFMYILDILYIYIYLEILA